jgi:hypothetical protein
MDARPVSAKSPRMETPSMPPRPKRRWKILKRIFAAFGLLLLAGVLWLFLSPDERPPDVSDLTFEPLKLPDDQNAYALAAKAAALVTGDFAKAGQTGAGYDEKLYKQRSDMALGKNWDPALAKQWLDGTDAVWPLWERAALTPKGQARWPGPSGDMPEINQLESLGQLAQIRARDMARRSQPDQAVESLLTSLQVAQRIQQSRGNVAHNWTGIFIRKLTLISLWGIATETKPSAAVLADALRQLEATRPTKESLALALRLNLRGINEMLDRMARGLDPFDEPQTFNDGNMHTYFYIWPPEVTTEGKVLRFASKFSLLFKPNKTRRIYVEYLRNQLGAIEHEASAIGHLKPPELVVIGHRDGIGRFWPDNFIGRKFLALIAPNESEFDLEMRLKEQSIISATEAFLALVLYYREHGKPP